MPLYSCKLCNISTKILSHYNRHLNTNKHKRNLEDLSDGTKKSIKMSKNEQSMSKNEQSMSTNEQKKYICEFCDKSFTTHANMRRHVNHYCKIVKLNKESELKLHKLMEIQKEEFNKEKEKLYHYIDKLIDKKGDTINIDKHTTHSTNSMNQINLNNYGKEDISYITDSFKSNLLKVPYGMIPKMIEAVHFNEKKPENNNISFPNKNENKLKIFSGNKWIYKDKNEIISDLIDGKYFILDTHYESICENNDLSSNNKDMYEKFRELFDNQDNSIHEQIKKDCELLLLNNR